MRKAEPDTLNIGLVLTFPDWWRKGSHRCPGPKLFPRGSTVQWLNVCLGWTRGQLLKLPVPGTLWALSNVLPFMNIIAAAAFTSPSLLPGACFDSVFQPMQPKVKKALAPFSLLEVQRFISAWLQELLAQKRQVFWGWAGWGPRATFWLSWH